MPFILLGTLCSAAGYGATFLIASWFRARGGSEIDAGQTLSMALLGIFMGVPLVGWCAGKIDASRLAALGALGLACGYALLGSLQGIQPTYLPRLATLAIGLGWGMFYLGAPLALSERLADTERGPAFTRFSAFQMIGICGSPVLLIFVMDQGRWPLEANFHGVAASCAIGCLLLSAFGYREPHHRRGQALRPWLGKITALARTDAIRPIVMVGLGGAVFSGIMAFQSSLVEGTASSAGTFFAAHAATAVVARLLLARRLSIWPRTPLIVCLLGCLVAGLACLLGSTVHPGFHVAAAVLTGAGYGLLYPVIQTWAVNGAEPADRHAALTWFVVAYFMGIFGFPALGGWLLVNAGVTAFVGVLIALALLELTAAVARLPRRG